MAYSYRTYPGTGAQTDFPVEFPYLEREHVGVTVDGLSTSFTWLNASTIRISPAPGNGTTVRLARSSNRAARLVTYANIQLLNERDLNYDVRQAFYVAQEAIDAVASSPSGGDLRAVNNLSEVDPSAARSNIGALPVNNPTITGDLTLAQAPTNALHAASKAYVDAAVDGVSAGGEVNDGANVGSSGARIFKAKDGLNLQFRRLVEGDGVSITEDGDTIQIDATGVGGGEVNTAANVGTGVEVFKEKSGVQFRFRKLKAGTGVTLTEGTDDITIDATGAGGGEVNAGANLNVSGLPLYVDKSGLNLRFKGVGKADNSIDSAASTAQDVLLKVNQAFDWTWTGRHHITKNAGDLATTASARIVSHNNGTLTGYQAHGWNILFTQNYETALDIQKTTSGSSATANNAPGGTHAIFVQHLLTGTANASARLFGGIRCHVDNQMSGVATEATTFYGLIRNGGSNANGAWSYFCDVVHDNTNNNAWTRGYGAEMLRGTSQGVDVGFEAVTMASSLYDSGAGFLVRRQNGSAPKFYQAFAVGRDSSNQGSCDYAFDALYGNVTTALLRGPAGSPIRLSGSDASPRDIVWNSGTGAMEFQFNGNVCFDIPIYNRSGTSSSQYALGLRTGNYASFVKASVPAGAGVTATPEVYIRIKVDGNFYRLALYKD